jgi:hypothetical protein
MLAVMAVLPGAAVQAQAPEQQKSQRSPAPANAERKKLIAEDSAKLLKLATDLKAEVDKTDKDVLSLGVIRKAGEVEKLAHDVKEKIRLAVDSRSMDSRSMDSRSMDSR